MLTVEGEIEKKKEILNFHALCRAGQKHKQKPLMFTVQL